MLYVTHDQVEAMTIADRLAVMNQGKLEQVGRPLDVYREPATLFVAQFLSSPRLNVLDGEIVTTADGSSVRTQLALFPLADKGGAGRPIRIGMAQSGCGCRPTRFPKRRRLKSHWSNHSVPKS
jgi:multiple sugar transport system ATP-binding protein